MSVSYKKTLKRASMYFILLYLSRIYPKLRVVLDKLTKESLGEIIPKDVDVILYEVSKVTNDKQAEEFDSFLDKLIAQYEINALEKRFIMEKEEEVTLH